MGKKQKDESVLKYGDLYAIRDNCRELSEKEAPASFSLKILKIQRLSEAEIKDLEELREPSDEYVKEYKPKVEALLKKYCKKDKEGNPAYGVGHNGEPVYQFEMVAKEKFDKEVEELEKDPKLKPLIDNQKTKTEKFEEALKEPCDVEFPEISEDILPDIIKSAHLTGLYRFIK